MEKVKCKMRGDSRFVFASGPEGGGTEDEVALIESKGFVRCSLGSRILRTDTATLALIAQFMGKD
jgi:16S rRNA (uracil1498-N3)-methyltransferase